MQHSTQPSSQHLAHCSVADPVANDDQPAAALAAHFPASPEPVRYDASSPSTPSAQCDTERQMFYVCCAPELVGRVRFVRQEANSAKETLAALAHESVPHSSLAIITPEPVEPIDLDEYEVIVVLRRLSDTTANTLTTPPREPSGVVSHFCEIESDALDMQLELLGTHQQSEPMIVEPPSPGVLAEWQSRKRRRKTPSAAARGSMQTNSRRGTVTRPLPMLPHEHVDLYPQLLSPPPPLSFSQRAPAAMCLASTPPLKPTPRIKQDLLHDVDNNDNSGCPILSLPDVTCFIRGADDDNDGDRVGAIKPEPSTPTSNLPAITSSATAPSNVDEGAQEGPPYPNTGDYLTDLSDFFNQFIARLRSTQATDAHTPTIAADRVSDIAPADAHVPTSATVDDSQREARSIMPWMPPVDAHTQTNADDRVSAIATTGHAPTAAAVNYPQWMRRRYRPSQPCTVAGCTYRLRIDCKRRLCKGHCRAAELHLAEGDKRRCAAHMKR